MRAIVLLVSTAAMAAAIMSVPAAAKPVCPAHGKPYAVTGRVRTVEAAEGQTLYVVYHPECGGTYNLVCEKDQDARFKVCVARLENATLTCK
jgi:hypothetical protein